MKKAEKFRVCDPKLWEKLRKIVKADKDRQVARIRTDRVLNHKTRFFEELLMPGSNREDWLKGALNSIESCEIVFLDPDNGLVPDGYKRTNAKAPKYVFLDELAGFWGRGKRSVVFYQHFTRKGSADEQVQRCADRIRRELNLARGWVFAFRWRRISGRWYIVIPAPKHRDSLLDRAKHFLENAEWGKSKHFTGRFEL